MSWNEFRLQAQQDLISCQTLFEKKDYGNSAYLLQQSLEKYVKSYFLRFELFVGNPRQFTHLPLIKMWDLLIENVGKKIKSSKKETKDLYQKSSDMLQMIRDYFVKITDRNDKRWKYGAWKSSLEIPLNSSENGVITQLKSNMERELTPLVNDARDVSIKILNQAIPVLRLDPQRKNAIESLTKKITNSSLDDVLIQSTSSPIDLNEMIAKTPIWFEQIEKLIKELVTGAQNKTSVLQHDLMKLLLLAWIFVVREELIITFPHEEMGRYPDVIDGINSRKLYENNASSLDKLIKQVSMGCKKIDLMLDL